MLILASQSPRRRELLDAWGISFRVMPSRYEEDNERPLPPETLVRLQAEGKARDVWNRSGRVHPVLGADTVVVLGGHILGKPSGPEDAVRMLQALSGKSHDVLTSVAVAAKGGVKSAVCRSRVLFQPLSEEEIRRYVSGGEPLDKAGAYAIQGEGKRFVAALEGSWSNVVGLPKELTLSLLREAGIDTEA